MLQMRTPFLGLAAVLLMTCPALAAGSARERPIELNVDVTEAPRRLLHARLVIPAAPGPLTLYYPRWIPGEHAPSGPIADLAGLKLSAGGKPLAWRRDDVDLYAFHCTVPEGADAVEVGLDYLAPFTREGSGLGVTMTPRLAILNWNLVLLYPGGKPVRDLRVRADLTLPPGWKLGTALPVDAAQGAATRF